MRILTLEMAKNRTKENVSKQLVEYSTPGKAYANLALSTC